MQIRAFHKTDFEAVQQVYLEGIKTENATFQTEKKDWSQWQSSMLEVARLVCIDDTRTDSENRLLGWAGLSAISSRAVYSGVAEVSIYVAAHAQGCGVGGQLLRELIIASEQAGIWTLQAAVFPENKASLRLHQQHGFNIVGFRDKLGQLKGVWRDVVLLERRSKTVGV